MQNQAGTFQRLQLDAPIITSENWYATEVMDATGTEAAQEWRELLSLLANERHGGPPIERGRIKAALTRGGGVPMDMRAEVWLAFSGAQERMAQHPGVYDELCRRVAAHHEVPTIVDDGSTPDGASATGAPVNTTERAHRVLEQVEKDLRRTEVGSDGDKLSAMRRVLCAFASFNPDVGYVQGMNFIVVALLRVFDEQQTFWMLALIVQDWLPDHFSSAMVGNHIDCRVLSTLTSEHMPRLAGRLAALDVSVQLLTTRWFLCLWSSVLPVHALHRLWDLLFVSGPAATMQAAVACMTLCEPVVLAARDIGEALTNVKEALRTSGDGEELLQIALHRIAPISREQLCAWRLHCRQLVVSETRHVQATRRLLKLQRGSGFALPELKVMARLSGPYTIVPADAAPSLLRLSIDYESFVRVLRGLVPQWTCHGGPLSLVERLFALFFQLPSDGRHEAEIELDRREAFATYDEGGSDADGVLADASQRAAAAAVDERPRLSFEQLVHGLGWLLRGTSARRARLCFRCFEENGRLAGSGARAAVAAAGANADGVNGDGVSTGQGRGSGSGSRPSGRKSGGSSSDAWEAGGGGGIVGRERFAALLTTVYLMYEPSWPVSEETHERVRGEAEQFVGMMYDLYDEERTGVLDAATFDRAAHQHPLLVQAFQLEQLDLPASAPRHPEAPSPLGAAHLRVKNGIYLGLRPGAVSKLDDSWF
jgi:hypothetical protein